MTRNGRGTEDDPHQLRIDWAPAPVIPITGADKSSGASLNAAPAADSLVQRLFWDFKTSFPQPTEEAIDHGVLDESDREPENLKALHDSYASQCLAALTALDKVMDARRRGVDPDTGNKPRTHAAQERLRKYLGEEPGRLAHRFDVLIDTYANAFGQDAADAFRKAIVAWHAGIEVTCGKPGAAPQPSRSNFKDRTSRPSSQLPVPLPLRSSVANGVFGRDENGKPIRPDSDEVRAITEQQAERMIDMSDAELRSAVTKYAEDFGNKAAAQLERYVRRQQHSR
jgi:hypothetical protein